MGIGFSVLLIAVGAILTFALDAEVEGLDLDAVGIILMIAGFIGLAVALAMTAGAGRGGGARRVVDEEYVDDRPVTRRRTTRDEL